MQMLTKHATRAPSPAFVISLIALFVALGGTTYAATSLPKNSVGTRQLKRSAVTSPKIRNGAVTASKINTQGLVVPSAVHAASADNAANADHATTAGSAPPSGSAGGALSGTYPQPGLAAPEAWHEVGTSGQPAFENGWQNGDPADSVTAGFYKDPFGVVHLKGVVYNGAAGTTIFTLPVGYRPSKTVIGTVSQSGVAAELFVGSNGSVSLITSSSAAAWIDGVTFRVGE